MKRLDPRSKRNFNIQHTILNLTLIKILFLSNIYKKIKLFEIFYIISLAYLKRYFQQEMSCSTFKFDVSSAGRHHQFYFLKYDSRQWYEGMVSILLRNKLNTTGFLAIRKNKFFPAKSSGILLNSDAVVRNKDFVTIF